MHQAGNASAGGAQAGGAQAGGAQAGGAAAGDAAGGFMMEEGWPKPGDADFCDNGGLTAEIKYLYYHKNIGFGPYVDANPTLLGFYCREDGELHKYPDLLKSHLVEFVSEIATNLNILGQQAEKENQNANLDADKRKYNEKIIGYWKKLDPNGTGQFGENEVKKFGDVIDIDTLKQLYNKKLGGAKGVINYLESIITNCSEHSQLIEDDYYDEQLNFIKYCYFDKTVDENTGKEEMKQCRELTYEGYFHKPYTEWEPSTCKYSHCITEYDKILRLKYKNKDDNYCDSSMFYTGCKIFSKEGNIFDANTCGTQYVPEVDSGTDVDNSEDNTSGATTLSSHVALFSLIMCIIFAFFK